MCDKALVPGAVYLWYGGSYETRTSYCPGAKWETQKQASPFQSFKEVSRPHRYFTPEAVVIKWWERCPVIMKHKALSKESGHHFIIWKQDAFP